MRPPRSTGPVRQGQLGRGGDQIRQDPFAGGHNPQWTGGDRSFQRRNGDTFEQTGGGVMCRDLQGRGPPCPQMATFAGDDLGPLPAVVFPWSNEIPADFEHSAGGNTLANGEIAAKGYFSNMMRDDTNPLDRDDYSSPCAEQQSQASQVAPAATSARPNHKRSKNFSDQEDEILVSAWLNISLDPVVGTNQKGGKYWSRIYDYFNEYKTFPSDRSLNSLMHRWDTIQKSVNKFCGCLTRIEDRRQSGATSQDKVAQACALYKAEDEHNKAFQFMHCWNMLRTQPKWLAKLDELAAMKSYNKKQKTSSTVSLNTCSPSAKGDCEVAAPEDNALKRPIGKKQAKAALCQEKKKRVTTALENMWAQKKETDGEKELKKDERFNKAFALEQERVANEKLLLELRSKELEIKDKEVELQNKRDEERIMTMDLTAMPDEQKKYYMCLRAEIMCRRSVPST